MKEQFDQTMSAPSATAVFLPVHLGWQNILGPRQSRRQNDLLGQSLRWTDGIIAQGLLWSEHCDHEVHNCLENSSADLSRPWAVNVSPRWWSSHSQSEIELSFLCTVRSAWGLVRYVESSCFSAVSWASEREQTWSLFEFFAELTMCGIGRKRCSSRPSHDLELSIVLTR